MSPGFCGKFYMGFSSGKFISAIDICINDFITLLRRGYSCGNEGRKEHVLSLPGSALPTRSAFGAASNTFIPKWSLYERGWFHQSRPKGFR